MVASSIRIWLTASDHVDFQYGQARVEYPEVGERITDRRGIVHWIRPNLPRYPARLKLSLLPEELLEMNSSPSAPRSALEWLEYVFRSQAEIMVFIHGATLAVGGAEVRRQLAYRCRIFNLPAEITGTLPAVGDFPETVELELAIHEDGHFEDLEVFSSYQAYLPSRT